MGRNSTSTKPFNGDDPRQVFWEVTLQRAHCPCGQPASMKFTTSMLLSDLDPLIHAAIKVAIAMKRIQPFLTSRGYAVKVGEAVACDAHRRDLEKVAACGKSYAIIDRDYGPGGRAAQVSVGGIVAP